MDLFSKYFFQDLPTETPSIPTPAPALNAFSPNGEGALEKEEKAAEDREGEKGSCVAEQRNPEARKAVGAAILKLGLELLENLKTGPEQPNVIISPLSISLALSQLALGERTVMTGGVGGSLFMFVHVPAMRSAAERKSS